MNANFMGKVVNFVKWSWKKIGSENCCPEITPADPICNIFNNINIFFLSFKLDSLVIFCKNYVKSFYFNFTLSVELSNYLILGSSSLNLDHLFSRLVCHTKDVFTVHGEVCVYLFFDCVFLLWMLSGKFMIIIMSWI